MNIFELSFESWNVLEFKINWFVFIILMILVYMISLILKKLQKCLIKKSIEIEEVQLGIGNSSFTLKYNLKDREIAYKLWVEMHTRKIGMVFDAENDLITEVYNSWYNFFGIARELMKDIPHEKISNSPNLIDVTADVLNNGLRPHLTKWQAKFRKWYENNKDLAEYKNKTPQEIQRCYPLYDELHKNLVETNHCMIEYMKVLKRIAYNN